MARFRELKTLLLDCLVAADWEPRLADFDATPAIQIVNPLLSFLSRAGEIKWRAVASLGRTVARLADSRLEDGRVVMRRLMWNLSEESGTLGWGSAETMAEIMACHPGLANEFHRILCSYIHDSEREGLFLDHAPLRLGAYWGVGRLAEVRPELVAAAVPDLLDALAFEADGGETTAAAIRGHAAWALGQIAGDGLRGAASRLEALRNDPSELELFKRRKLETTSVGALSREALERNSFSLAQRVA